MAFLDPRHGYGLFDEDSGPTCATRVGRTDDGGAHFTGLVAADSWPCGGYRAATNLAFDDHGDGFLYGTGLFVSHDGGSSWAATPTPEPVVAVAALGYSVWMVQAACPAAGAPGGCRLALSVSADGGRSWTRAATLGSALAGGNAGGLFEPAQGQTWLVRTSTTAAYLMAPPLPDPTGAPDAAPLWHTTDAGRTWTTGDIPCSMAALSVVVSAAPGGKLWAVCAGQPSAGYQGKTVQTSTDGGATWQLQARCTLPSVTSTTATCRGHPPDFGYLGGIDAVSDGTAFLVGPRSALMVSRDGGATWDAVTSVAASTAGGTGQVIFFDARHGLVLGDDDAANVAPALWSTDDGGLQWQVTIPRIGS